ncbi:MAG TPA: PAS domain-containing sensor histidine kinase [Acidobacteriaceae bacterium]|nr:PAS domain-containing sensor histidine kinase [Acidobacteriaceae bacterium]
MYAAFFGGNKRTTLFRAALLIVVIAVLDWRIVGEIPLGILYLIPMLLVGSVLSPWQIATAAVACTALAEEFDDLQWNLRAGLTRDLLYFIAFCGAGFLIREVNRNRTVTLLHLDEIERQSEARREAEEQLRILIETSPAAILTADAGGSVLMANEAAHRMLALEPGALAGRPIHRYLPSLRNVASQEGSQQSFRTVMQARGQRENGETFLADISFSTYRTDAGLRLAAMVLDASEELRTHEVSGLHQLLAGSRIALGAMSHEIRNVTGAIGAVHQNLVNEGKLANNRDFEALGHLIAALERIANLNLRQVASQATQIDLAALLDELRIVIEPTLEEEEIQAEWTVDSVLSLVWADRPSLMQVFLNLTTNSIRALARQSIRSLAVTARNDGDLVIVEFTDTGGGVSHPEFLFRPFQAGADASGLGLYLSRAFLRSFGGELRYAPAPGGSCFIVSLNATPLPAPSSGRSADD